MQVQTEQQLDPAAEGIRFNPNVAALPAYNAGLSIAVARSRSGRDDIAALASNENLYGCSPVALRALASPDLQPWRYSDPACTQLRDALATASGANPEQIVIGNGSEEMIAAIARAALVPGDHVVTVVPSFGLHEIEPLAAGTTVHKVSMMSDLEFDVPALEAALGTRPRIAFLSSPSNPVGCALDADGLDRIVAAVRPGTLLVLDEAYHEFAGPGVPNGLRVLRKTSLPHVVLILEPSPRHMAWPACASVMRSAHQRRSHASWLRRRPRLMSMRRRKQLP